MSQDPEEFNAARIPTPKTIKTYYLVREIWKGEEKIEVILDHFFAKLAQINLEHNDVRNSRRMQVLLKVLEREKCEWIKEVILNDPRCKCHHDAIEYAGGLLARLSMMKSFSNPANPVFSDLSTNGKEEKRQLRNHQQSPVMDSFFAGLKAIEEIEEVFPTPQPAVINRKLPPTGKLIRKVRRGRYSTKNAILHLSEKFRRLARKEIRRNVQSMLNILELAIKHHDIRDGMTGEGIIVSFEYDRLTKLLPTLEHHNEKKQKDGKLSKITEGSSPGSQAAHRHFAPFRIGRKKPDNGNNKSSKKGNKKKSTLEKNQNRV